MTAAAPARLRGRIPLRLGIVLGVLAIIAIVVGAVVGVSRGLSKVNAFPRVAVPTSHTVATTHAHFDVGGYIAYYEARHIDMNSLPPVPVRLTSPSGHSTVLHTPYGGDRSGRTVKELTYDYGSHHGAAEWQFHVSEPGRWTIEVLGDPSIAPGTSMAFGHSIAGSTVAGALLIIAGVLLFIAALVLIIVGIVRRHRHKNQLAHQQQAGGYGVPAYAAPYGAPPSGAGYGQGYGQPAPGAGYPPPGYQPGYGQQGFAPPPPPPSGEPQAPRADGD